MEEEHKEENENENEGEKHETDRKIGKGGVIVQPEQERGWREKLWNKKLKHNDLGKDKLTEE